MYPEQLGLVLVCVAVIGFGLYVLIRSLAG
jgi:hypothetical protein